VAHDGGTIIVDASAFPICNDVGKVQFIVVFQKDITDRKLTEQKLQTSYEFLKITNQHRDLHQMLDEFMDAVRKRTGYSGCAVRILKENGGIPYVAYNGLKPELCQIENDISLETDGSLCAKVILNNLNPKDPCSTAYGSFYFKGGNSGPIGIEDLVSCDRKECIRFGYRFLALIPIRVDQKTLGLIQIADEREDVLPRSMVETLEAGAMQLGPAIQRVRAEEALKNSVW
jgi:GAF domain-containing protein